MDFFRILFLSVLVLPLASLPAASVLAQGSAPSNLIRRAVFVWKAGHYKCLGARIDDTHVLALTSCVHGSADLFVAAAPKMPILPASFDVANEEGVFSVIRAPLPESVDALTIGSEVHVGQDIQSVTLSDASGENRFITVHGKITGFDGDRIDTDLPYGHRGSPLFDTKGHLIGIGNIDIGDRSFARVMPDKVPGIAKDSTKDRPSMAQVYFSPFLEWAKVPATNKQGGDIGLDIGFRYNDGINFVLPITFVDPTVGARVQYRHLVMPATVDELPLSLRFTAGVRRLSFEGTDDDESRFVPEVGFGIHKGWWGFRVTLFPAQSGYTLRYL